MIIHSPRRCSGPASTCPTGRPGASRRSKQRDPLRHPRPAPPRRGPGNARQPKSGLRDGPSRATRTLVRPDAKLEAYRPGLAEPGTAGCRDSQTRSLKRNQATTALTNTGGGCGSDHSDQLPRWIRKMNPSQDLCNGALSCPTRALVQKVLAWIAPIDRSAKGFPAMAPRPSRCKTRSVRLQMQSACDESHWQCSSSQLHEGLSQMSYIMPPIQ